MSDTSPIGTTSTPGVPGKFEQVEAKVEAAAKSALETVEHLVGIGKTTAAKAVTAAEPAIAQAEAAIAQATTQVEAGAAATLATGALPGAYHSAGSAGRQRPRQWSERLAAAQRLVERETVV